MGKITSRQPTKRRKTTDQGKPMAAAPAGAPAFQCLLPELWETIFGLLDVRTLCTARLVCSHFHGVASMCIHSVKLAAEDLRSRPETNLNSFPNLSRVALYGVGEDDLPVLALSPVAAAVTHLETTDYLGLVPRRRFILACLPLLQLANLVSLTVSRRAEPEDSAFPFPQTLRELTLQGRIPETLRELTLQGGVPLQTANLVARLTNLTCLRMDLRILPQPFAAVSALTALQHLEICSPLAIAPFLAPLTQLTHLQFKDTWLQADWTAAFPLEVALASLTCLHRLVHLGVGHIQQSFVRQFLASLGTFSSLRSLALGFFLIEPSAPDTSWMTPFSRLTALRLERGFLNASILPRVNGLQDLSLSPCVTLCRVAIDTLNLATGLTRLRLSFHGLAYLGPEDLGAPLSRMPRLRALSFSTTSAEERFCFGAIGLLSELTMLECVSGHVSGADVKVCLCLTKLRVLRIVPGTFSPPATDADTLELLLAIAKLPELTEFRTNKTVWDSRLTDGARGALDAERLEKGWPPFELIVED